MLDRSSLSLLAHRCSSRGGSSTRQLQQILSQVLTSPHLSSLSSYNSLIKSLCNESLDKTVSLYTHMLASRLLPDHLTFPFLLKSCSFHHAHVTGRALHSHIFRLGFVADVYINNSLVFMYSACGQVELARRVFEEMPERDVISENSMLGGYLKCGDLDDALGFFRGMEMRNVRTWNSIIAGFVRGGRCGEALDLFNEMRGGFAKPDKITVASVVSACASLGALDMGKWVHGYLRRERLEFDLVIGTSLIDMYGKCGSIERAFEVFREMSKRDVQAWTVMISVLAIHGRGEEAFVLLEEMEKTGMRPNNVTFGALLSACAHSGTVDKGRWCFDVMRRVYSIEPQLQHYACMVDLLGRAGLFEEAEMLMASMPMKPDVFVWGALLGACRMHGNVELGEKVAGCLISMDPLNHAYFIILSDIYANAKRFEDVKRIRDFMEDQGIKKTSPGRSLIEIDGQVYEFSKRSVKEELMKEIEVLCDEHNEGCSVYRRVNVVYEGGSITAILVFFIKESIQKEGRAPIAGTDFHQLIYFDTLFDYQTDIARKHQTYRLLKPSFSDMYTIAPANVEHVLKTNFSKYSKGQFNYNVVKDLLGDGIFAVDGDKWRQQRKLASYEFSTKVLREFSSDVFRATGVKLANKVGEAANSAAPFDMQDVLMKATLDSIFKVGFGVELNTLSGSDEFGYCFSKAFDESNYIVFRRYVDIFWETKKYFNIGLEAKLKKNIQVIDDFVFQLIRHKREHIKCGVKEKAKEDILSRFILASQEQPEAITDRYLRDIILNFLIAGKDTSANTLSWFFYMMCKNPLVQEKIVDEIKHATGFKGLGAEFRDFAMSLTENVIDKMQYLHAALTETLRLYPAVPVDGKVADEDDVLPDGFKVKKGDGVYYLAYSMGRMISLWGEDAEDYRPERWLDNGSFKPESPFKFVAFNAGPRICLGKEFAYRQMKILAAMLLYFFKFKLEDESMRATYRVMFTLHIAKGLPLLAFHRCN